VSISSSKAERCPLLDLLSILHGPVHHSTNCLLQVKKWSFVELERFKNRWKKAVKDDECWTDMYR